MATSSEGGPGDDRPAIQPGPRPDGRGALAVAVALALGVAVSLLPWPSERALWGEAGTDALRALWGLDHLRRSWVPSDTPVVSAQINAPAGVVALILPAFSGSLLAWLGSLFGPVRGYNLFLGALLWADGMAAAALTRRLTGSWAAGLAVGAAWASQPMVLTAVADGTPEHAALWAMPVFLAAAWRALATPSAGWALAAGLAAGACALDSPYLAIYTGLAAILLLPFAARGHRAAAARTGLGWALATIFAVTAVLALGIGALYARFPIGSAGGATAAALQGFNVARAGTWRALAHGGAPSGAPTWIPTGFLLLSLGLALLDLRRAAIWALAGLGMVGLAFGTGAGLPQDLGAIAGAPGAGLGRFILAFNGLAYRLPGLSGMRFPERWLVPAALLLGVAGAIGGATVLRAARRVSPGLPGLVGAVLAALAFAGGPRSAGFAQGLPTQTLPRLAFADALAQERGGVALLPVVRAAPPGQGRNDAPVFAHLDAALAGADREVIQVLHGQPQTGAPSLQTLAVRDADPAIARLLRDWDDLARPRLTGDAPPPEATDPRADRAREGGVLALIAGGIRFVVVDEDAYSGAGLTELRRQLGAHLASERRFDEGTGVVVFTLR